MIVELAPDAFGIAAGLPRPVISLSVFGYSFFFDFLSPFLSSSY